MPNRIRDWINRYILDSPGFKTFCGFVLPILSGILSGTLIAEISTPNGLDWKLTLSAKSTYGIIILSIIIYKYNRALFLREKEIRQFSDKEYCLAYMRSKCLPEAAEKYKERIRSGKGGELEQAMRELKKILK